MLRRQRHEARVHRKQAGFRAPEVELQTLCLQPIYITVLLFESRPKQQVFRPCLMCRGGSLTRSIGKAKLQRQQAERLAAEASPALASSGRSGSMLNSAAASGLMLVASEARSHVQQAPCRIAASSVSSVTRSSRLELQRGERRWRDQTPHQVPDSDIRA